MFRTEKLSTDEYSAIAEDTFSLMEAFAMELSQQLWERETTLQQIRVSTLVLARQLAGKISTVTSIAKDLGIPRSSAQHAVIKLVEHNLLSTEDHPEDGRKKVILVPKYRSAEIGMKEQLLIEFRLKWHMRLSRRLSQTKPNDSVP